MLITESKLRNLIRSNIVKSMLSESSMKNSEDLKKFCEKHGININQMYQFYPHADEFWDSTDGRKMINGTQGDIFLRNYIDRELRNLKSSTSIDDLWDPKTGKWTSMGKRTVKEMIFGFLEEENKKINKGVEDRIIAQEAVKNMIEFGKQVAQEESEIRSFFKNLILVLEDCKKSYPKVWNARIIDNEIDKINVYITDEGIIGEFDEFMEDLMSEHITFKRNYPAEIIFNNIISERVDEFEKMCGGGASDAIPGKGHFRDELGRNDMSIDPRPITKRIWKTLMLRLQKKKQKISNQSGGSAKFFNNDSKILQRAGKETGDFAMPEKLKNW